MWLSLNSHVEKYSQSVKIPYEVLFLYEEGIAAYSATVLSFKVRFTTFMPLTILLSGSMLKHSLLCNLVEQAADFTTTNEEW